MHALLSSLHSYLQGLSAADIIVVAGTLSTAGTYLLNNLLNLQERRFVKAFLGYIVAPGVVTALVAIAGIEKDFLAKYPDVIVVGQIAYYTVEKIIASATSSTNVAPVAGAPNSPSSEQF